MGTGYWEYITDVIETATPEQAQARLTAMSREQRSGVESIIAVRRAAQAGEGAR
jgi:hypothetical protein